MKPSILVDVIVCFFILLFAYTGIAKLMEIHLFKEQLVSSPFLGALAGIIAWGLPITELLLVICMMIPRFRLSGLWITLGLMSIFTIYVILILFIDKSLFCSCGGIIEKLSPGEHILFNSACVVLASLTISMVRKKAPSKRLLWVTRSAVFSLFLMIGWTLFTAFTAPVTIKTGLEGRLLPKFILQLPDSVHQINTADIPEGHKFVVIGFLPTCVHCQAETRDIIQHIGQLKNTQIYYVTPYSFSKMKEFYQYFKLSQYPNITVGHDFKNVFLPYFNGKSVPYTLVFDSKKRLLQVNQHQVDVDTLAKFISE